LNNFVPDIIITDLSMPRMEGGIGFQDQAARGLCRHPILVLAARRSTSELPNELPNGAAAVIFKDIDIEAQLGRALALPRLGTRSAQRNSRFASADTSNPANSLDIHFEYAAAAIMAALSVDITREGK